MAQSEGLSRRAVRMPAWMTSRRDGPLPLERQQLRLAAYVYGNILVLAGVVIATGKSIVGGEAALLVGVTMLTTYVAHVLAHMVAQQLGHEPADRQRHVAREIRDATPILVSGIVPAVILLIASLSIVPTQAAQLGAALWVITRLALIGFLVERLSDRPATWRTLSGGVGLALAGAIIVVLKVLFAH